ncbi:MAG: hypothetical protein AAFR84_07245 [Pseudomonadota bacterium]
MRALSSLLQNRWRSGAAPVLKFRLGLMPALLVMFALACESRAAEVVEIEHEGITRLMRVANAGDAPRPAIILLHGYRRPEVWAKRGDDLSGLAWRGLEALGAAESFVVAHPASLAGRWGIIDVEANRHPETGETVDDVGFVLAATERLVADGLADPERLYLAGISDGGILSLKLLCKAEHGFAGAAPLIPMLYEKWYDTCEPQPVRMILIAGTNDRILFYDGWLSQENTAVAVPQITRRFAQAFGCDRQKTEPLPDPVAEDRSSIKLTWYRQCDDGPPLEGPAEASPVWLMRVEGGGHTLPHPDPVDPDWEERAGGHNRDIDTAEEVWRFFSAPRMPTE